MEKIQQEFFIHYTYSTYFTSDIFSSENGLLANLIQATPFHKPVKILIFVEERFMSGHLSLNEKLTQYFEKHTEIMQLLHQPIAMSGGESIKNDKQFIEKIYQKIAENKVCRHSLIMAIGGGALLDAIGYASATAHRGIPLIRVPTTVLAQGDSGVGVKNSVNYYEQKNFLGTFAPPYAVINDNHFLQQLSHCDWLSGIAEAIKVALIKDKNFFSFIEKSVNLIHQRDLATLDYIIYHSAKLHIEHIGTGGDPFEKCSARPLDFGHWAAHRLEVLSNYQLKHGEAVAIGMALDVTYAYLQNFLGKETWRRVIDLLKGYRLPIFHACLELGIKDADPDSVLFQGIQTFREHLGGELTLMMIADIGRCFTIHHVDYSGYQDAISLLHQLSLIEADLSHAVPAQ